MKISIYDDELSECIWHFTTLYWDEWMEFNVDNYGDCTMLSFAMYMIDLFKEYALTNFGFEVET